MSSGACVMMPPYSIHIMVFSQANKDDRVSKARMLILRTLTFSIARFSILKEEEITVRAYSKAMKNNIKAMVHYPKLGGHKIYFSIDHDMSAKDIIEYYRTRFQIE